MPLSAHFSTQSDLETIGSHLTSAAPLSSFAQQQQLNSGYYQPSTASVWNSSLLPPQQPPPPQYLYYQSPPSASSFPPYTTTMMHHQTHTPHAVQAAPAQLLLNATAEVPDQQQQQQNQRNLSPTSPSSRCRTASEASAASMLLNSANLNSRLLTANNTTATSPTSLEQLHVQQQQQQQSPQLHRQQQHTTIVATTIGLGIDPFFGAASTSRTATVAAVKAVRDAMERGILRFPSDHTNLYLHIQLGVPAMEGTSQAPLPVELSHLTPLLPRTIPLLPVELQVGGLLVRQPPGAGNPEGSAACTACACITLQRKTMTTAPVPSPPTYVVQQQVPQQPQPILIVRPLTDEPITVPNSWAEVERQQELPQPVAIPTTLTAVDPGVRRSASIDMLAHVSATMHAQARAQQEKEEQSQEQQQEIGEAEASPSGATNANPNYNYKKLPPGVTTKKNKRLFVQHNYKDHSEEVPKNAEEVELAGTNAPERSPNAPFPLKLHEILWEIERDGYDHVIGWLPHGRSFKIHQQQEFVETILPKYFVMTKKSSFLRQLNLYGFNRLSAAGGDQGSYYHEKFLRGMKFLCRRIHRQKVNGNGIRAAGNPDGEPNLNAYPPCPPGAYQTRQQQQQEQRRQKIIAAARENDTSKTATVTTRRGASLLRALPKALSNDRVGTSILLSAARNVPPPPAVVTAPEPHPASIYCGGLSQPASFPLKLQRILDKLEAEGDTDIISWLPHGRAFLVYNVDRFVNELMPRYFNQTKYSSFQRQLHMYHFERITAGHDKGAYHHPSFQRGHPELCFGMTRTRVNGKRTRRPGNPDREPHFDALPPLPAIAPGARIEIPHDSPQRHKAEADDHSHDSSEGTWHSQQQEQS